MRSGQFLVTRLHVDAVTQGRRRSLVDQAEPRNAGCLGNAGQHLLFYNAKTLDEISRISTLRFETARRNTPE